MSIDIPCLAKLAVMQRSKLPKMPLPGLNWDVQRTEVHSQVLKSY